MMKNTSYSLVGDAKLASNKGKIGQWLLEFLQKTEAGNPELLDFVEKKLSDFRGPELVTLHQVKRTLGYEEGMFYTETEVDFRKRVNEIKVAIENGLIPAPLLAEKSPRGFLLLDGNHTYEAIRELGREKYWVIYYEGDDIAKPIS